MKLGSNDPSYELQDSCRNCNNVFKKQDYDSEDTYYCIRDRNKVLRPMCGSTCMRESTPHFFTSKAYDRWLKWVKGRRVSGVGKCKHWELTQRG